MIFGKLKTLFFGLTMKKSLIVSLHIGYWLCFALVGIMLLAAFSRGEELEASRLEMVFYVFSCMGFVPSSISFYAFYYFLFPKYLKKKKITKKRTKIPAHSLHPSFGGASWIFTQSVHTRPVVQ